MDWKLLPVDEIKDWIKSENNPENYWTKVIDQSKKLYGTDIWEHFRGMPLKQDISEFSSAIQEYVNQFPDSSGIYFGLDTLNMDNGNGSNVEIGLSNECDPRTFSDEWTFECDHYGNYLIKGLFQVSESFQDPNYSGDITSAAEYIIFLAYSGIILREGLNRLDKNDFQSIWGFHDGDMFFLMNCIDGKKSIISEQPL
jgi:hypothetical protein